MEAGVKLAGCLTLLPKQMTTQCWVKIACSQVPLACEWISSWGKHTQVTSLALYVHIQSHLKFLWKEIDQGRLDRKVWFFFGQGKSNPGLIFVGQGKSNPGLIFLIKNRTESSDQGDFALFELLRQAPFSTRETDRSEALNMCENSIVKNHHFSQLFLF